LKILTWSGLAVGCLLAVPAATMAAGLEGSQVTVTAYCCSGPIEADRFTVPLTATVESEVEFPSGSIVTTTRTLIKSSIDVSAFAIDLQYTDTNTASVASFNGYGFDFADLGDQRIAGVSLNPLSTFSSGVGLSFDNDSVFYNGAGLSFTPASRVLIDVALAPVPEAGSAVMLLAGLALVSVHLRRRHTTAAAGS
jgi:hypothetical protein